MASRMLITVYGFREAMRLGCRFLDEAEHLLRISLLVVIKWSYSKL
jgi:hypothetical protein